MAGAVRVQRRVGSVWTGVSGEDQSRLHGRGEAAADFEGW